MDIQLDISENIKDQFSAILKLREIEGKIHVHPSVGEGVMEYV